MRMRPIWALPSPVSYTHLDVYKRQPQDIPLILRFIRELADYEGMLDQVVATEELLNQWLFEKEKAEVILRCV